METGGKQYRVAPGQVIQVDHLDNAFEGDTVELDKVLLFSGDDKVTVGTPTVEGAKVVATSQGERRGRKVIVFRYKSKVRSRRKTGSHHLYTRLSIDKIVGLTAEPEKPKRASRRKKEVTESGT
ncbi:MAG: 50S ribosomal protein L21 [Chloroflexota bacterium]